MRQVAFDVERFPFGIAEGCCVRSVVQTAPLRKVLVADFVR